ncbi:hypothetical protein [Aquimarina sp. MMG016]|uniref:hypothetical protein n=1 Tax=Aquimarina sp. MMG016 TaxID=2822690 RepID=UPI001B3A3268|nr:hypothetical protein [Aquimarina sp. MMG016]MBQ4821850.1 hypothetical protein [Aquimarina sp. MMG016]
MQKRLYFICPTDHLESVINKAFKQENYYCTSLGNSIRFTSEMVGQINALITTKEIKEITFVLSSNNHIITDALKNHDFMNIRGLANFYNEIHKQKLHSEVLWQTNHRQFLILSYYLNMKIKELHFELSNLSCIPVKINGKIYSREENVFKNIYSDLICIEKHYVN